MINSCKRVVTVYGLMLIALCVCFVRVVSVGDGYSDVSGNLASRRIELGQSRGVIYDRNMNRLTCNSYEYVCAVKPSAVALNTLKQVLDEDDFSFALQEAENGNPFSVKTASVINSEDIITSKIYKRYNDNLASHVIGYLSDGESNGAAGIEAAFENVLSGYNGSLSARFFVQADGASLAGADIKIEDENYNSGGGVVLTIDSQFQYALEKAMDDCGLEKGCGIIVEVQTGAVRACASRPVFDRNDISSALDDEALPLFNRALGTYPAGSVFKPLIALCAVEQGVDPSEEYECKGYMVSGGKTFKCMKNHGTVNMWGALAYSCNCYFIDLFSRLDKEFVLDAAQNLGFGSAVNLAENYSTYSGNLPDMQELESQAESANFSFGQGRLSANIFQLASLYCVIANAGEYYPPFLVYGLCDSQKALTEKFEPSAPFKLFSKQSTDIIRDCLELAVREGTGKNAQVESTLVCGKTATAQSGDYSKGEERLVTWFAGFYPYEEPEYVIVIMCEDGESGSADCAPVFSRTVSALLNIY